MAGPGQRLEGRVLGKGGPRFLDFRQLRVREQVFDEPAFTEDRADLAGLMGVAGGEEQPSRSRAFVIQDTKFKEAASSCKAERSAKNLPGIQI